MGPCFSKAKDTTTKSVNPSHRLKSMPLYDVPDHIEPLTVDRPIHVVRSYRHLDVLTEDDVASYRSSRTASSLSISLEKPHHHMRKPSGRESALPRNSSTLHFPTMTLNPGTPPTVRSLLTEQLLRRKLTMIQ